jgi:hypothetical protein
MEDGGWRVEKAGRQAQNHEEGGIPETYPTCEEATESWLDILIRVPRSIVNFIS